MTKVVHRCLIEAKEHIPLPVYYINCDCGHQLHWALDYPKKYAKCSKCGTRFEKPELAQCCKNLLN